MSLAVIYARYSSSGQTEQSIEGQVRVCRQYAKDNAITIVDTYVDRAKTGQNDTDFRGFLLKAFRNMADVTKPGGSIYCCRAIQRFYRSDKWKIARAMKIASAGGRCEMCGGIGTEVHHKVHLTPENVADPEVSISQDNLMLLCSEGHNKVHGRFEGSGKYGFDEDGNLIPPVK